MRVNFTSPNPSGEVLVKFICLDLGVLVVPCVIPWALLYTLVIHLSDLRIGHAWARFEKVSSGVDY
jgi:hypothetical protein